MYISCFLCYSVRPRANVIWLFSSLVFQHQVHNALYAALRTPDLTLPTHCVICDCELWIKLLFSVQLKAHMTSPFECFHWIFNHIEFFFFFVCWSRSTFSALIKFQFELHSSVRYKDGKKEQQTHIRIGRLKWIAYAIYNIQSAFPKRTLYWRVKTVESNSERKKGEKSHSDWNLGMKWASKNKSRKKRTCTRSRGKCLPFDVCKFRGVFISNEALNTHQAIFPTSQTSIRRLYSFCHAHTHTNCCAIEMSAKWNRHFATNKLNYGRTYPHVPLMYLQ